MKKSTKLLSVILAIVMIFSCMSVMASAYQAYGQGAEAEYTSNDTGLATLLTDEQRASWFCDLVNGLLASANIKTSVPIVGTIDFTSLDALCDTIGGLKGVISFLGIGLDLGILRNLNLDNISADVSISNATNMVDVLVQFVDNNVDVLGNLVGGSISFGILSGAIPIDLTEINKILTNLDVFLKGTVYGLGARDISIGDDPDFPNDTKWDNIASADRPTMDSIVKNLLVNMLTTPQKSEKITDPSQNLICTNPEAYGATAAMIHSEAAVDRDGAPVTDENGKQLTWYYIYGTKDSDGNWKFTEATISDGSDKQYINHWRAGSALLKNFDTSILNFETKTLYQMLGDALPWAYDTFGATNLDGQLRATIMQFCGAFNDGAAGAVSDEVKATLKAKMNAYKEISDNNGAQGGAKLSDKFESTVGEAGNYNFAYFSLSNQDINTMPDDLYYVVEWDGSWEFYHVDFSRISGEKLALFQMLDWEWQAPAWSEMMPTLDSTKDSYLRNITDAVGHILEKAVKPEYLNWTFDSASEDNAHFESNVMGLVRTVLKAAPKLLYGAADAYKAADIDSQTDEQVLTVLGADIMTWLMPALVLPEDVSCLEALVVYGVREFIAEIMPEYNWETQIAAAKTDEDYLNIALDMGLSIGIYYLKNVMALGTTTNGSGTTTYTDPASYMAPSDNCATGWNTKLNYIVDQVIAMWLPGLSSKLTARNATVFNGTDALDKLSVTFNALFPGLLSLVSGCSATIGDGTNKDCVVDLKVVKDLIAGILNLEIEPIAAKLYRNSTGYANKTLYDAVVNILIDLTKGIGFNDSNDYANLTSALNTALAQANPLDYIVTNANLRTIVKNLLWSMTDTNTRGMWVQNVLALLMQLTKQMDDMTLKGTSITTDKAVYYGSSVTVIPNVMVDTTGIPSVWYQNGYRGGNRTLDGIYTAVLNKYVVLDFNGNQVTSVDVNANLTLNTIYSGTSISLTAPTDMSIYTVQAYITVTTPDGIVLNNGEPMMVQTNFMMTAAAQGDDTAAQMIEDGDANIDTAFWNIYIDETEPLQKAESYQMTVYNRESGWFASTRTFFIDGYGYNVVSNDGTVVRSANDDGTGTPAAGSATWTKYINTSTEGITVESGSDPNMPFYWNWNSSSQSINKASSLSHQQWLLDQNVVRSAFPDDFTTLLFSTNSAKCKVGRTNYNWKFSSPYIVIYNSYGLQGLINRELASGKQAENYTADSWAAYKAALAAAVAEFYAPRKASTFAADHTTNGVSNFKLRSDALQNAIKELKAVSDNTSATDFTAEEKAVLADLKTALDKEGEIEGLNNQNYIMYRWLKYYNERAWLWNVYNGAQIPSGIAQNDLKGVPSDNEKIAAAIAAAPAGKRAALNKLVEEPTADEIKAAKHTRDDYLENFPELDLTSIQVDKQQMTQYRERLVAKAANKQYLNMAINLVAAITDSAAYTAESWAEFAAANSAANTVAAKASALPSEIHEARYDLLVAYKGLVPVNTEVDLTALQDVMAYVDTVCANPNLFQATADSGLATLDEALALVLAEAGVKVTVGEDTYFIGGNDTGAAWLEEAGKRLAVEDQATVDRIVKEIKAALENIECAVKIVPDDDVADNTTAVDYSNLIVDGLKPGTINTKDALLALIKTTAPAGYTANLDVTASADIGFGTGTKVVLTLAGVDGFAVNHTVMVYGDVNGDGAIDAFDAALINMSVSGKTTLAGDFATAGDTTADGDITAADYTAVAQVAVGNGAIPQTR